jgi:hypothetical protein
MYEYFNIPLYSIQGNQLQKFIDSKAETKIVVVRNPYDRLLSAINNTRILNQTTAWTRRHSRPYLQKLVLLDLDYKIIDFYRLGEYIPIGKSTVITNSSHVYACSDDMKNYQTPEAMKKEYDAYQKIMSTKHQISPQEWKNIFTKKHN